MMQTLTDGFELLVRDRAIQPQQFRSPTMPLTLHCAVLIEVVAMLQMLLCIASAASHCPNRQHKATLRLFEIAMQALWSLHELLPTSRERLSLIALLPGSYSRNMATSE